MGRETGCYSVSKVTIVLIRLWLSTNGNGMMAKSFYDQASAVCMHYTPETLQDTKYLFSQMNGVLSHDEQA